MMNSEHNTLQDFSQKKVDSRLRVSYADEYKQENDGVITTVSYVECIVKKMYLLAVIPFTSYVAAPIIFGINRTAARKMFYFDSSTGHMLNEAQVTKTREAHALQQQANDLLAQVNQGSDLNEQMEFYQKALHKYQSASDMNISSVNIINKQSEVAEKIKATAKVLAQQYWAKGWAAEQEDEVEEAKTSFAKAHELFEQASAQQELEQVILKEKGNNLFNQAVDLVVKEKMLSDHVERAKNRNNAARFFSQAHQQFQKAATYGDARFQDCITMVEGLEQQLQELINTAQESAASQQETQENEAHQMEPEVESNYSRVKI